MKSYVITVRYSVNHNGFNLQLTSSFTIGAIEVSQYQANDIARILFPDVDNLDVELKKVDNKKW